MHSAPTKAVPHQDPEVLAAIKDLVALSKRPQQLEADLWQAHAIMLQGEDPKDDLHECLQETWLSDWALRRLRFDRHWFIRTVSKHRYLLQDVTLPELPQVVFEECIDELADARFCHTVARRIVAVLDVGPGLKDHERRALTFALLDLVAWDTDNASRATGVAALGQIFHIQLREEALQALKAHVPSRLARIKSFFTGRKVLLPPPKELTFFEEYGIMEAQGELGRQADSRLRRSLAQGKGFPVFRQDQLLILDMATWDLMEALQSQHPPEEAADLLDVLKTRVAEVLDEEYLEAILAGTKALALGAKAKLEREYYWDVHSAVDHEPVMVMTSLFLQHREVCWRSQAERDAWAEWGELPVQHAAQNYVTWLQDNNLPREADMVASARLLHKGAWVIGNTLALSVLPHASQ